MFTGLGDVREYLLKKMEGTPVDDLPPDVIDDICVAADDGLLRHWLGDTADDLVFKRVNRNHLHHGITTERKNAEKLTD
jgi:hypothetical protein